jgi:hypothetical protein
MAEHSSAQTSAAGELRAAAAALARLKEEVAQQLCLPPLSLSLCQQQLKLAVATLAQQAQRSGASLRRSPTSQTQQQLCRPSSSAQQLCLPPLSLSLCQQLLQPAVRLPPSWLGWPHWRSWPAQWAPASGPAVA